MYQLSLTHRNKHKQAAKNEESKKQVPSERADKTPEKKISKIETCNIPDTKFKIPIIKILKELRGRVEELHEDSNKEMGNKKS